MKTIKTSILLIIVLLSSSCIEEDFFGYSPYGEIKNFQVSNQSGRANINNEHKTVEVEIPGGVALDQLTINELEVSSFAKPDVQVGSSIDLREPARISLTAEDGTVTVWTVEAFVASSAPQLTNSNFQFWHQVNAGYYEPGESQSTTIWGTGNPGGAMIDKIATTPLEIANGNNAAHLETLDNGFIGQIAGTPITAATIYTGKFNADNIDLNNPRAAVELGTPFTGRPSAFTFNYQYTPGAENKDRGGNILDEGDQLDIYMFLEIRQDGKAKRLATGWFRSGDKVEDMTGKQVDLIYGALDSSFPEELLPEDGYVSSDSVDFILPTHISFLATSSYQGDKFAGAVGSTLIIDDLELVYGE